jgi:hypothetical protein
VWFEERLPVGVAGALPVSPYIDRHIKLMFPKDGVTNPEPLDVRALRKVLPAEDLAVIRTFAVLLSDVATGTVPVGRQGSRASRAGLGTAPGVLLLGTGGENAHARRDLHFGRRVRAIDPSGDGRSAPYCGSTNVVVESNGNRFCFRGRAP